MFLKGGAIIPIQKISTHKITNTYDLSRAPITIVVAPDHTGRARGSMIIEKSYTKM